MLKINGDRFLSDINMRSLLGMCVEYWLKDNDTIIYAYEYKNKTIYEHFQARTLIRQILANTQLVIQITKKLR